MSHPYRDAAPRGECEHRNLVPRDRKWYSSDDALVRNGAIQCLTLICSKTCPDCGKHVTCYVESRR